jgi:EAL domain-containing protein (putative c-di-GMP-specific phosphodiesterase class I)
VAEGVETREQLDKLKNAECDLVQGYYFSRPLPPVEFEALIEKELKIERENEA